MWLELGRIISHQNPKPPQLAAAVVLDLSQVESSSPHSHHSDNTAQGAVRTICKGSRREQCNIDELQRNTTDQTCAAWTSKERKICITEADLEENIQSWRQKNFFITSLITGSHLSFFCSHLSVCLFVTFLLIIILFFVQAPVLNWKLHGWRLLVLDVRGVRRQAAEYTDRRRPNR